MRPMVDRPYIAHEEYGVPRDKDRLIEWAWVADRFREEANYWIATASPQGIPTARPVWGVFVHDAICFGGGPLTRWSKNLAANPRASVHLESGTRVVIAEGPIVRIEDPADPMLRDVDDAYEAKYEMRHGPPIWVLRPHVVLAWTDFPKDMTRFRFE
jgi:Pyridoxamine 5'-phosphate oxidase